MRKKLCIVFVTFLIVAAWSFGQTVIPNEFVDGETASAEEVNANFQAIADAVDALPVYTGLAPIHVDALTIGLNPATSAGDVLTWDGTNWVARPDDSLVGEDNIQPYLATRFIIALQGVFPSRNEPFLGEIMIVASNFPPRGWAFCDGQLLAINQYQALYSLLGTTYGGDGRTTFGLPDLRGRVPIHAGTGPGLTPRSLGAKGGTELTTR